MLHHAYYVGHPMPVKRLFLDPLTSGAIPKNLRDVPGGISRPVRIGDEWWAQPDFWQQMAAATAQTAQAFNVIGGGPIATTGPVTTQVRVPAPSGGYYYPQPSAGVPTWVWAAGATGLGLVVLMLLMPSGARRR